MIKQRPRVRKRRAARWIGAILVAALLAACGRTDPPRAASTPAPAAPIVISASFDESGPLAATAALGSGVAVYLARVNAAGGVDGHKIIYNQYDDDNQPSQLVANARRAVEQDRADVFISFGGVSTAVRPYLNQHKVMHLVFAGNTPFSDVARFPYSHAWWPDLGWESAIDAAYLAHDPGVKLGVLGFDNDLTDSQVGGARAGGLTPALVLRVPTTQLDLTSQVTQLKAAGVNAVLLAVGNAQAIGAIKYMNQIGYYPKVFIYSVVAGILTTLSALPNGMSSGLYSTLWLADPMDPKAAGDQEMSTYRADVAKYGNGVKADNSVVLDGYAAAEALVNAIKTSNVASSDGINAAWSATRDLHVAGLPSGTTLSAGPGGRLVYQYQISRYDGTAWDPIGMPQNAVTLGYAR